jgi:hypothetical protein
VNALTDVQRRRRRRFNVPGFRVPGLGFKIRGSGFRV